jgi:hypothetical protein
MRWCYCRVFTHSLVQHAATIGHVSGYSATRMNCSICNSASHLRRHVLIHKLEYSTRMKTCKADSDDKNLHVEATLVLLQNRIVSAQPAFFSGISFALSAHKQFRTTICGSCTVGIHSTSHCTSEWYELVVDAISP